MQIKKRWVTTVAARDGRDSSYSRKRGIARKHRARVARDKRPGSSNLITGVALAYKGRAPVIVIAGDVPRSTEPGRFAGCEAGK